jgi:hypothetical protein
VNLCAVRQGRWALLGDTTYPPGRPGSDTGPGRDTPRRLCEVGRESPMPPGPRTETRAWRAKCCGDSADLNSLYIAAKFLGERRKEASPDERNRPGWPLRTGS